MSKNEEKNPFYINMKIESEGLTNLPKDMKPEELFVSVAVNAIVQKGKKSNGLKMAEHSQLYKVRSDLMNAIKVGEAEKAKLDYEDFKFLMKCWNEHTPDPQANELVIRVWNRLKEAQSNWDKTEGGEDKKDGQDKS